MKKALLSLLTIFFLSSFGVADNNRYVHKKLQEKSVSLHTSSTEQDMATQEKDEIKVVIKESEKVSESEVSFWNKFFGFIQTAINSLEACLEFFRKI